MIRAVTDSITIAAPPEAVWRALVAPDSSIWRGADYVSDWQPGSPLVIRRAFGPKTIEDHGIVTEATAPLLLGFRFLSSISHLPDVPENHSTVTLRLDQRPEREEPLGQSAVTPPLTRLPARTELTVTHTVPDPAPRSEKAAASGLDLSGEKHVAFYWRSTLPLLRDFVEGRPNIALDMARRAAAHD